MCAPAPTDTDDDYVILTVRPLDLSILKEHGFVLGGSDFLHTNGESAFQSWKKGDLNLIFTADEGWFDRMLLATKTCMALNEPDKAKRIIVFQAIVYGNAP